MLLPAATLNAALPLTSPIQMLVTETSGDPRTATVQIFTHAAAPAGTYKLYLAVVEKTINYNSPNGETVHLSQLERNGRPSSSGVVNHVPLGLGIAATDQADSVRQERQRPLASGIEEPLRSQRRFELFQPSQQLAQPDILRATRSASR